jgi:hypothetical protein
MVVLRQQLGRSIELFRTTAAWVEAEVAGGGRLLSGSEKNGLRRLQAELESASSSDIAGVRDLIERSPQARHQAGAGALWMIDVYVGQVAHK